MRRTEQIQSLLAVSKQQLSRIEESYNSSLHKKSIDPELQILIKNYLENLRSALDYLAREILENILLEEKNKKVYFPITKKNQSFNDFKSLIGKYLPRLDSIRKDIFDALEKIQPYHDDYEWLADFAILVNNYKHQDLTPQEKIEIERVSIKDKCGGEVQYSPGIFNPNGGITIRPGQSLIISAGGNVTVAPGQSSVMGKRIDPMTQLPENPGELEVKRIIWVDFTFEKINKSALRFLRQAYSGIKQIIVDISNLMK